MSEWRAFDYMNADGVEDISVQRGDVYDPFNRLSFDAYDDEHAELWCQHLNALEARNTALVRVVEKLLANVHRGSGGHLTGCRLHIRLDTDCTCGVDEARALLAKIRGEKDE